ncbi:MAG: Helicase associated domain protein [Legionellales bacterium]|nr:Helicase associated domain protein [Legionellales bacterium]
MASILEQKENNMSPELYDWCLEQRELYKNGELSEFQINKLKEIGFIFDENEAMFRSLFYSDKDFN